jgi:hypothetical protein
MTITLDDYDLPGIVKLVFKKSLTMIRFQISLALLKDIDLVAQPRRAESLLTTGH